MRILITGATGLIGTELVRQFHYKGFGINFLTTAEKKIQKLDNYRGFFWDPSKGELDTRALESVGAIIHLAGANIFTRWTKANRRRITRSRIGSANLLFQTLEKIEHTVGQFVSASGISLYPSSFTKLYNEEEKKYDPSFLGKLVVDWEKSADQFRSLGIRVAKVRTGLVLTEAGGALPQMKHPVELGLGAALGSGKQWQSWIHIEDLARLYVHIVTNGLEGTYNAVAPSPVTNEELMQKIAEVSGKRIFLPNVPGFAMKLVMGQMADIALASQLVDSKKVQQTGFNFNYVNLRKALLDLQDKDQN